VNHVFQNSDGEPIVILSGPAALAYYEAVRQGAMPWPYVVHAPAEVFNPAAPNRQPRPGRVRLEPADAPATAGPDRLALGRLVDRVAMVEVRLGREEDRSAADRADLRGKLAALEQAFADLPVIAPVKVLRPKPARKVRNRTT
jgi:hypothetical protein